MAETELAGPQDRVVHEGWLNKESAWIKVWRPRYFRLWESGALDWHLDDAPLEESRATADGDDVPVRGSIAVAGYVVRAHPARPKKAPTPYILCLEPVGRKSKSTPLCVRRCGARPLG